MVAAVNKRRLQNGDGGTASRAMQISISGAAEALARRIGLRALSDWRSPR